MCGWELVCVSIRRALFPYSFTDLSAETVLLRYIRDNVLSKIHEGRELIKLYYQWSPVIVKAMEADEEFKEDVKELVDAVMGMVEVE